MHMRPLSLRAQLLPTAILSDFTLALRIEKEGDDALLEDKTGAIHSGDCYQLCGRRNIGEGCSESFTFSSLLDKIRAIRDGCCYARVSGRFLIVRRAIRSVRSTYTNIF